MPCISLERERNRESLLKRPMRTPSQRLLNFSVLFSCFSRFFFFSLLFLRARLSII